MKINSNIVNEAARYVTGYLASNLPEKFAYHNLQHTQHVVESVTNICENIQVAGRRKKALQVAAWFHDLGYAKQTENHETHGALAAETFLIGLHVDSKDIELVKACILATRYPQSPKSKLEKIICDADLLHLAEEGFLIKSDLLRKEWAATRNAEYSDQEWYKLNLEFLKGHSFQTSFCRKEYATGKEKNIETLERLVVEETNDGAIKPKKGKGIKVVRGAETLFKNSSRNHMELSSMADNKAHILLSISSLIISVILSFLVQQLVESPHLILPTGLLLLVCIVTIVMAVLTTKPKVSKGVFTIDQINRREVNLLFFGNFHNMDLKMYEWGIQELMTDKEYLYDSMTKDIFYLGKVLAVKYHYLNIGYRVFMYGLVASVIAFSASMLIVNI